MVILVADTTSLSTFTGSSGSARNGLNQVSSTTMPRPPAPTAGTLMRRRRTRALWRRAARIRRARSRGPVALQACVPAPAIWEAIVRLIPMGSLRLSASPVILSFFLGFRAQNCAGIWPRRGGCREISGMREYVFRRPARQVEPRAVGKKAEAGSGKLRAAFAGDQGIELFLDRVQVHDVRGRIGDLGLAELLGAPVRELLLLRQVDTEDVAHQILEAMLVRIGAGQTRRDLGAIDRRRH